MYLRLVSWGTLPLIHAARVDDLSNSACYIRRLEVEAERLVAGTANVVRAADGEGCEEKEG